MKLKSKMKKKQKEIRKKIIDPTTLWNKVHKVFFYLTCWRPFTRYEAAKMAQNFLIMYNNHAKQMNTITKQLNNNTIQLHGQAMAKQGKEKDNNDPAFR